MCLYDRETVYAKKEFIINTLKDLFLRIIALSERKNLLPSSKNNQNIFLFSHTNTTSSTSHSSVRDTPSNVLASSDDQQRHRARNFFMTCEDCKKRKECKCNNSFNFQPPWGKTNDFLMAFDTSRWKKAIGCDKSANMLLGKNIFFVSLNTHSWELSERGNLSLAQHACQGCVYLMGGMKQEAFGGR